MKKLVHIFLFIGIINTLTFAEVTREDVDRYLEVSRGGEIFKDRLTSRYYQYFSSMYGYNIKQADKKTIKEYQDFVFNAKYEEIFYKTFEEMDDNTYYEIMAFYKTDLGKKYTQAFKKLYKMDIQKEIIISIVREKEKKILPKRRKLVTAINDILYGKLYIDLGDDMFTIDSSKEYAGQKILDKNISSDKMKMVLYEFYQVFNELAYKDFSDAELFDILEYAKTYGKIEISSIYNALQLSREKFLQDLEKFIKNKDKKIE